MSNNYDEYEYDDSNISKKRKSYDFLEKIGVILLIVSAIIIILMLVKSCGNSRRNDNNNVEPTPSEDVTIDYESALLAAGKKYYENNRDEYPESAGECSQVTLQTLIIGGLLDANTWKNCNTVNTYVRVCMLENRTIQYTPWFACNDKLSNEEIKYLLNVNDSIYTCSPLELENIINYLNKNYSFNFIKQIILNNPNIINKKISEII